MAMSYKKTLDNIFKKAFGSQYKTKYTKPHQQQIKPKPYTYIFYGRMDI